MGYPRGGAINRNSGTHVHDSRRHIVRGMARLYSAGLLAALQRQVCHRDAAQYGQTDIGMLHRLGSPTVTRSARKQCPRTDDLLTTGLLEGRDVLESTDCQTQVKFGQE